MKFTESHEWIRLENEDMGVVGITEHSQQELGEIVYIELPKVGARVKAGDEVCVLESTKAAADIYSPVSGTITAVNNALTKDISLLNQQEGWLFKVKLSDPEEYHDLLDTVEYESMISS